MRSSIRVTAAAALAIAVVVGFDTQPRAAGGGWSTSGTKILTPTGQEFRLTGINWYGFETRDSVAHGLWSKDYKVLLDKIKEYGFNTVRIPFSNAMWGTNPKPGPNSVSACAECKGKNARDILALIVNYAGSIGLHVILDNHRSGAGNSAEGNGLWYTSSYPESIWIRDWVSVLEWTHGIKQTLGAADTITVNYLAADGYPTVIGLDLRNEPHTPSRKKYLDGATWGTGDGIDPRVNPNPNPFTPACVSTSTCHDWRLAAERAGTTILGRAAEFGWDYPLIIVDGIGMYPSDGGNATSGPYDGTWWGGNLLGVNGNSTNAGAPVLVNAGGSASGLGPAVNNKVVYSAHDYGPNLYVQSWFNSGTCYKAGCGPSSLADVWKKFWAYINIGQVNPQWFGKPYPWGNTGHTAFTSAPMYIGEFGTGNTDADLYSATRGSQGQWFTDMVNFIQSSHTKTTQNDSGLPVTNLHFAYWSYNANDSYGLLGTDWISLANPKKDYSFLCMIQSNFKTGLCGSTGPLPAPF
jgi:aryl-phospho-beta-D-glucosidase BglC (GH1 family)